MIEVSNAEDRGTITNSELYGTIKSRWSEKNCRLNDGRFTGDGWKENSTRQSGIYHQ